MGGATLAVVAVAKQRAGLAEPTRAAGMAAGGLVAVARTTVGADRFPGVGRGPVAAGRAGGRRGEWHKPTGDQPGLWRVWAA